VATTLAVLRTISTRAMARKGRARLEKMGRRASFVDGQIAAIAVVNDAILVTRNVRDYRGFSDLVVENWLTAA